MVITFMLLLPAAYDTRKFNKQRASLFSLSRVSRREECRAVPCGMPLPSSREEPTVGQRVRRDGAISVSRDNAQQQGRERESNVNGRMSPHTRR